MLSGLPPQCLTCVVCFQGQCLYSGLPIVHFWVELGFLAFCIRELWALGRQDLATKGRLRRQLYVVLLVNSLVKLLRDSLSVFQWDWGPLGVFAISLIPTSSVSVDLVLVSYWAQVFHHDRAAAIAALATVANVLVHSVNFALCALRVQQRIGHHSLLLFWGVSLGLMSLLYINFIPMVLAALRTFEGLLGPDRCRPLRRSLSISGLVATCYVVRSVVYCLAAFDMPPVFWLVGSAPRNTLYLVLFVFVPSWVTMVAFSARVLQVDQPQSLASSKSQVSDYGDGSLPG